MSENDWQGWVKKDETDARRALEIARAIRTFSRCWLGL